MFEVLHLLLGRYHVFRSPEEHGKVFPYMDGWSGRLLYGLQNLKVATNSNGNGSGYDKAKVAFVLRYLFVFFVSH